MLSLGFIFNEWNKCAFFANLPVLQYCVVFIGICLRIHMCQPLQDCLIYRYIYGTFYLLNLGQL